MSIKLNDEQITVLKGAKEVVVSEVKGNDITLVSGTTVIQVVAPQGHKVKFGQIVKVADGALQIDHPVAKKGKLNPSNKDLRAMGF